MGACYMIPFIHHSGQCKPIYSERKQLGGYWGQGGWGSVHKRTWANPWEWRSFSLCCLRCWLHGYIPDVTTWQTEHLKHVPFTRYRLYFRAAAMAQLLSRDRLCNPMDCSPPGSSVHGILQARILEWVAISSSKGSSWPRDGTYVSCISCISR